MPDGKTFPHFFHWVNTFLNNIEKQTKIGGGNVIIIDFVFFYSFKSKNLKITLYKDYCHFYKII